MTAEEKEKIQELKDLTQPIHAYPDYNLEKPLILDTHFSARGVLAQVHEEQECFFACLFQSHWTQINRNNLHIKENCWWLS